MAHQEVLHGSEEDYARSAQLAGLEYVRDEDAPGYRRKAWGRGFTYLDPRGRHLKDAAVRARIQALAIPPDWHEVWVARSARAHLQATGRDAAGRKQYIYHALWDAVRQRRKFRHVVQFARQLPQIRAFCDHAMRQPTLAPQRVLAVVVTLLDRTMLRVGNEQYLQAHGSRGLVTLASAQLTLSTTRITFDFVGKSAVEQHVELRDRRLAAQLSRLDAAPGERLFSYQDDSGEVCQVDADEVNDFLHEISGMNCSAKDFRTWGATRHLVESLIAAGDGGEDARQGLLRQAIDQTADALGNTARICRDYYLHPAVLTAYETGAFWPAYRAFLAAHPARDADPDTSPTPDALSVSEALILWLVEHEELRAAPQ